MVTVKYHGMFVKKIGTASESFESGSIKDLLKQLKVKYGKEVYSYAKMSYILVNDINVSNENGYKTKLVSGDIIQFLPVCGGG